MTNFLSREEWQAVPLLWDSWQWESCHCRASAYATPDELGGIILALKAERRAMHHPDVAILRRRKRGLNTAIRMIQKEDQIPLTVCGLYNSPALAELQERFYAAKALARQEAEARHRAERQSEEGWQAYLKSQEWVAAETARYSLPSR
jgi:hypothetical protein